MKCEERLRGRVEGKKVGKGRKESVGGKMKTRNFFL